MLLTTRCGYYRGQRIILRCNSELEKTEWVEGFRRVLKSEEASFIEPYSFFRRSRRAVRFVYMDPRLQWSVAFLIIGNFFANIVEAQIPATPASEQLFVELDKVFTSLFTIELMVNLHGTLVREFVSDVWNWFDVVVVVISVLSLVIPDLPGGGILKILRTFRVFRLFKRIKSLKQIISALQLALPGMSQVPTPIALPCDHARRRPLRLNPPRTQAYVLVMFMTAIYAILAVVFFGANVSRILPDSFLRDRATRFACVVCLVGRAPRIVPNHCADSEHSAAGGDPRAVDRPRKLRRLFHGALLALADLYRR
jgi:hypothetical protein